MTVPGISIALADLEPFTGNVSCSPPAHNVPHAQVHLRQWSQRPSIAFSYFSKDSWS